VISSRMVGGRLQIVRDEEKKKGLPGATPTQVNGNQVQLPDGTWMDPSTMLSAPGGATASATLPEIAVAPARAAAVPAPANQNNPSGGMMRKPLGEFYQDLEAQRGLPQGYLAKTRAVESSNGTRLQNPNSSAGGDFQFIDSTAKAMGLKDRFDPYQAATAAADLAAKNKAGIVKATGREPSGGELYAAHQQGLGGYLSLTRGQNVGADAARLNGGAGMAPQGFLGKITGLYDRAKPANLGEGFTFKDTAPGQNTGQGPTVAAAAQTPSGVPAIQAPAAPAPDNTYKGGLLGLAGVGDQSAPGMDKGFLAKLGDMSAQPGGGALGGVAKAISSLAAPAQQSQQPGITIAPPADGGVSKPDASLMAYLDPRKRRMMGA
jgi:hypothetical protein